VTFYPAGTSPESPTPGALRAALHATTISDSY
jgi:hypothetical protein